jgi:hypothetical protein
LWFDFQLVGIVETVALTMPPSKRYKQLKLGMDSFQYHYDSVVLSFTINRKPVCGILKGNSVDWMFQSDSPAFLKLIPSGTLNKYAIWWDAIPKDINKVYNGILEASFKAGYDLCEKE